jgi:hypothetical protein
VPVQVAGVDVVSAVDITLDYDPKHLRFVRMRRVRSEQKVQLLTSDATPGTARAVLASASPLAVDADPVMIAVFERLRRSGGRVVLTGARVDDEPAVITDGRR